jgi:hypothetical protein
MQDEVHRCGATLCGAHGFIDVGFVYRASGYSDQAFLQGNEVTFIVEAVLAWRAGLLGEARGRDAQLLALRRG